MLVFADSVCAGCAGDPEVRGAGVEVDDEGLAGSTDGDRARPLYAVILFDQRFRASGVLLGGCRGSEEVLDDLAFRKAALVRKQVAHIPLILAAEHRTRHVSS